MGPGSELAGDISLNSILSEAERAKYQDPATIRKILHSSKTIAIVGLSPKSERPSHFVGSYLASEGYRVIPVNPRAAEIFGEKAYPDLLSIPFPIDVVDVFRNPDECVEVARQAAQIHARALWLQLRIANLDAAEIAERAGLDIVMDRCIKIEHGRYTGSLHWVGMNTEIVTARRGQRYI
ncbi:MAG: CoA-binding protein [Chloroflexota bacterium]|nr:MAG: CoA-binding protein [Chloroflexota bacterium]